MDWKDDTEFATRRLERVVKSGDGYELHQDGGWVLYVKDPGFEPKAGESARFYGLGIGHTVRGVVIGDRVVYYRTAEEDEKEHRDRTYPPTAREALARWDAGDSIFTVSMGGLGPGYEQCIHIAAFEIIRALLDRHVARRDAIDAFNTEADAALAAIDGDLGMSGAQAGAAKSLAFRALCDGWQAMMLSAPDDRRIQVSKHWPRLKSVDATTV